VIYNVVKTVTDTSVAVITDHSTAKFNEILGKFCARVHLSTTAITDAIKGAGTSNKILTPQARRELIGVSKVALMLGLSSHRVLRKIQTVVEDSASKSVRRDRLHKLSLFLQVAGYRQSSQHRIELQLIS